MDSSKEFQLMLDKAIESEPEAFKGFDRTKNVQDQLQEMVVDLPYLGSKTTWRLHTFYHFCSTDGMWERLADLQMSEVSMEQLWLAFVQRELHNKVWDGEWLLSR